MNIVISQPLFFPWVGMFEQIRLADIYVHYGDVQYTKGWFINRVQIKTAQGIKWLTVPLEDFSFGQKIDQVKVNRQKAWRERHRSLLQHAYRKAPYCNEMLALVDTVYSQPVTTIGELTRASLQACCQYYGLDKGRRFIEVESLSIAGSGSPRVLEIVKSLGADTYITGWGARSYLQHEAFERAQIQVAYMDYQKRPYPQLYGEFTPYVSILDLIANTGSAGEKYIVSNTIEWKEFLNRE